ncbi:hypothetical protein FQZ97_1086500 [compost metagenome]
MPQQASRISGARTALFHCQICPLIILGDQTADLCRTFTPHQSIMEQLELGQRPRFWLTGTPLALEPGSLDASFNTGRTLGWLLPLVAPDQCQTDKQAECHYVDECAHGVPPIPVVSACQRQRSPGDSQAFPSCSGIRHLDVPGQANGNQRGQQDKSRGNPQASLQPINLEHPAGQQGS